MRHRIFVVVVLTTAVLMVVASSGDASHRWGKYHWAGDKNPRVVPLIDSVATSDWGSALDTAAGDWNASTVIDTPTESGSSDATTRSDCPAVSKKVRVCNYEYGDNGWLGIAEIWVSRGKDGHIAQGRVKLNDTYFGSAPYNTSAWRQFVACQEVGHTLGLGHTDENFGNPNQGTCMDYTSDPDGTPSNLHPNGHDFAELEAIYAHLDGAKKPGPPFAGSQASDRSTQVRQDGEFTVITFIYWA